VGWLELYTEYAKNNEASPLVHLWTGLTILGASLKRNVSYSKGYYTLYPNLWALIVAPSGHKKTTGVSIGYNILSKLDYVKLLPDKGSPEGLVAALAAPDESEAVESQGLLYAPELANFMDRRTHNEGLVPLLLRLADCPDSWKYRTKGGGLVTLHNIAISFLGATAPDLLYDCMPSHAMKSGFLARFLCILDLNPGPIYPFPWKSCDLETEVLIELERLSLLQGAFILPPKVQEWYVAWYFRHKAAVGGAVSDKLKAYFERKPDYLLKLGMLVAVSDTRILEFTIKGLEKGLAYLDNLEEGLNRLYTNLDASTSGREGFKIQGYLKAHEGCALLSTLQRDLAHTLTDSGGLEKILDSLVKAQIIRLQKEGSKGERKVTLL